MNTRNFSLLFFILASLASSTTSSRFPFARRDQLASSDPRVNGLYVVDGGEEDHEHPLDRTFTGPNFVSQHFPGQTSGGDTRGDMSEMDSEVRRDNTLNPRQFPKSDYASDNFEHASMQRSYIRGPIYFDVRRYGAVGNGVVDDSQAFLKAWQAACGSFGNPVFFVHRSTFLLKPITFQGPCRSPIYVKIMGKLTAPNSKNAWKGLDNNNWIVFSNMNNVIIDGSGSGELDGQGAAWWKQCNTQDCVRPVALRLHKINNLQLKGLRHVNSAKGHIGINDCSHISLSYLTILAPKDSPNTDGLDISSSAHISIDTSTISTGDDCVAINGGTSYVNITNVFCGPGHGISVGSLGAHGGFDTVEEVRVNNCVFQGTQNGVRIKTWQGGAGYARRIAFSNIRLVDVQNPIIIDQYYCGGGHGCSSKSTGGSSVDVSDVTFSGLKGTSANENAITLRCASSGCKNIVLHDINIVPAVANQKLTTFCSNVHGRTFMVAPNVPCLAPTFV